MNTALMSIKCGNCNGRHSTASEVRACYYPPRSVQCNDPNPHARHTDEARNWTCPGIEAKPRVTWNGMSYISAGVTQRQLSYIMEHLGGNLDVALAKNKDEASAYIDQLKRERRAASVVTNAPNRQQTKIPLAMLHAVPDGYYASRPDSTRPYTFFKISRPKSGKYAGTLKVMTQHGPDYKMALAVYPGDRVYWSNMAVEDDLLLVVVDPNGCAIAYADEIGRCMRCNTELTDERSRWYGIGPECEKVWPHIIDQQNDRKGPYVPGWELR